MKIRCLHGYFIFEESQPGDISRFMSQFGLGIVRKENRFTFSALADAPDYSLPGGSFLGCPTTVLFEGDPWEVMRANGIVYDFTRGLVVPITSVTKAVRVQPVGNYYLSSGMILSGSVTEDGQRVMDYAAHFDSQRFKYTEVSYG